MDDAARSDEELVEAARQGDRTAVELLLARHEQQIYRFGMRMCRNPEDAKDVLQETMIAMAKNLPTFRGQSSIATWLYTIARSFCIKQRRLHKSEPATHDPLDAAAEVPGAGASPEEAASARQTDAELSRAIATLTPEYREVLWLRDAEGLTAAEVGAALGLTIEAVKSRLHRARVAVRAQLTQHAVAAPGCPDIASLLSQHIEGDITSDLCATMESHLAGCAGCRATCDSLRDVLARCRRAGHDAVPVAVQHRVRVALQDLLRTQSP